VQYRSATWPMGSLAEDCVSFHGADAGSGGGGGGGGRRKSKGSRAAAGAEPWAWLCAGCLRAEGAALVGCPVKVWWTDDEVFYEGAVGAFDSFSGAHRIKYADGEWEFVNLASEPYVIMVEKRDAAPPVLPAVAADSGGGRGDDASVSSRGSSRGSRSTRERDVPPPALLKAVKAVPTASTKPPSRDMRRRST
jgi:hypothetical protein